jgi:hypothetical protein
MTQLFEHSPKKWVRTILPKVRTIITSRMIAVPKVLVTIRQVRTTKKWVRTILPKVRTIITSRMIAVPKVLVTIRQVRTIKKWVRIIITSRIIAVPTDFTAIRKGRIILFVPGLKDRPATARAMPRQTKRPGGKYRAPVCNQYILSEKIRTPCANNC